MSIGKLLEALSQAILVGRFLVGRLGVSRRRPQVVHDDDDDDDDDEGVDDPTPSP